LRMRIRMAFTSNCWKGLYYEASPHCGALRRARRCTSCTHLPVHARACRHVCLGRRIYRHAAPWTSISVRSGRLRRLVVASWCAQQGLRRLVPRTEDTPIFGVITRPSSRPALSAWGQGIAASSGLGAGADLPPIVAWMVRARVAWMVRARRRSRPLAHSCLDA